MINNSNSTTYEGGNNSATNNNSGANNTSSTNSYYAASYSGWLNYGSGLVTNIIENLQLKINDVHIRYEDSLTIDNLNFGCGIKIESLSAQSCDSNWIPGFTSAWNQNIASYKLLELRSFSFYWDRYNQNADTDDIDEIPVSGNNDNSNDDESLNIFKVNIKLNIYN